MWRELFKLAGLKWGRDKGLVWHTLRHEFCSRTAETPAIPWSLRNWHATKISGPHRDTCIPVFRLRVCQLGSHHLIELRRCRLIRGCADAQRADQQYSDGDSHPYSHMRLLTTRRIHAVSLGRARIGVLALHSTW